MLASCTKVYEVPTEYTEVPEQAPVYPDYRDLFVPANIAPLNFMVKGADGLVVVFEGEAGEPLCTGGSDRIDVDSAEWRSLLSANVGRQIRVTTYARFSKGGSPTLPSGGWIRYAAHTLSVAEPIDAYLSYRLIEPGYELYRQLGLYQRNLENFVQTTIYENNRQYEGDNNHCVNCHNYQNYDTENMLFHVRANHGGTVVIEGDRARKVQIKNPDILAAGVYPSWHPKKRIVAFSTNKTGQVFHLYHKEKIEVIDEASDLLLYDVDRNEVQNIITGKDLETFPCWSPDGDRLYYCCARFAPLYDTPDSLASKLISDNYDSIFYDLKCVEYDQKTGRFGKPEMVVEASADHRSISVPRVSPDGRYVLFTLGDYGQFHIWHKSSDLWVKDLQRDSVYALSEANSDDVDSYHTWSSNGRWIVFSSRRMDGNYTRPFIAYFDREGRAHKAFCLPQRDPEHNVLQLRSYNVPELTRNAVRVDASTLRECIYGTPGDTAKFTGSIKRLVDGSSGASPQVGR